jgi:hypothetical protein
MKLYLIACYPKKCFFAGKFNNPIKKINFYFYKKTNGKRI